MSGAVGLLTWWLSFCDNERPKGHRFLGVCVVLGSDVAEAIKNAHLHGCNPGGDVVGAVIPGDTSCHIGSDWRRRLLTREECGEMDEYIQKVCPAAKARARSLNDHHANRHR